MTLSEGSSFPEESFATAPEEESASKTRTSRSSTSSSNSSHSPLDVSNNKPEPMNLVLKTRMASKARQNDLSLTATKSTIRTSFTSHTTGEFAPVPEEVTVTDDGPVIQQDLKEEDVYKKLSELNIAPDVPNVVVATPSSESRNNKSSPATSTSGSHHDEQQALPAVDVVPEPLHDSEGSDNDSVISDISGLTGNFTRTSKPAAIISVEEEDILRRRKDSSATSFQEEEDFTRRSLQRMACAASAERRPASRTRKGVSFSTVCIREYERILGDNPSCSCGPSIAIGWNYYEEDEILSINEWESWRETEREPERLVLSREEREELLLDLGYNQKVIAQAVRDIVKVKNKRRQTITNLGVSGVEELLESSVRKVKKIRKGRGILGRKKKRDKDEDEESIYA